MMYNVWLNESRLVLSADDGKVFFENFARLPSGEYTVEILGDSCRPVRHHRRKLTTRAVNVISLICDIATVLAWLLSCIALWIIVAFFG